MKIAFLVRALYQGVQLSRVETWKKAGVATAAMTAFLSALVGFAVSFGWIGEVDVKTIAEVSSALVTLVGAVLAYFQVATTEKIGIKPRAGKPTDGVQPMHHPAGDQGHNDSARSDVDAALRQWGGTD